MYLLVYVKIIESGTKIKLSSDNESVNISTHEITVNEADAVRHVAKYEFEVLGQGIGQNAIITAESGYSMALLGIRIRSKKEPPEKKGKGMFKEPRLVTDPKPTRRTSYSRETGEVLIYVNFPSIKHYIGDECQYKKTLAAQILVADLVAERCFYEMAVQKVELGVVIRPEAKPEKIRGIAEMLSQKYGKKAHEALVDQSLVDASRNIQET